MNSNNSGHLHLHNSYFIDPLFGLSQTEYEIGQYKIQYKNLIAQYSLVIVQQLCTVYSMNIANYCVLNFAYVYNIKSTLFYHCSYFLP